MEGVREGELACPPNAIRNYVRGEIELQVKGWFKRACSKPGSIRKVHVRTYEEESMKVTSISNMNVE